MRPSPRLTVRPLEDRVVPAVGDLYLSELHFDPLFGSRATDEYVELRGRPNATVAAGTYLVVLDGDAPGAASFPGTANAVFDLGGLTLGSDGYLVILQQGNGYPVRPTAATLTGTGPQGFAGLPGNRFAGTSTAFEFIFGANTFALIESPTKPAPGIDYDANDDGTLDGGASRWTVLDSVGVLGTFTNQGNANQIGYGKINFAVDGLGRTPAGSTLVPALDFGYVARVGESTGSAKADWVAGLTARNAGEAYRLESSIFGFPTQGYLAGRPLDHIGTANFVASVGGTKFLDANRNGRVDPGEGGQAGSSFYLDRNRNGVRDSYTTAVDADTFPFAAELTNAVNGVTFTEETHLGTTVLFGRNIRASDSPGQASTGTQTFGRAGIDWFDAGGRLRMDFYKPVQSVGIDFISGALVPYFGRLDVFNADGVLLQTFRSDAVQDGEVARLEVSRPSADIAYATAYSDAAGSPFGRLDNLSFTQPEDTGVSGPDGAYKVDGLQDGSYRLREVRRAGFGQTFPNTPGFYEPTVVGTVPVRGLTFGNGPGGGALQVGNPVLTAAAEGSRVVAYRSDGTARLDPATAQTLPILPLATNFTGVVRSAAADVTGDGIPDIAVVTGPGTPARFAVYDGTDAATLVIPPTPVFGGSEDFDGGAFVSAGDIDGDGRAELVFTADQGGGPRVSIYSVAGGLVTRANFIGIADADFRGGARSAVGDINGDGRADLVVAAGFGGGPRVAVYDGRTLFSTRGRLTGDFFAFDTALRDGVFAAVGDVDGDGFGDLVFGAGEGGSPRLLVVSGQQLLTRGSRAAVAGPLANFFVAGADADRGGVRVSVVDLDGDRRADVAAASGDNQAARIRTYLGGDLVGGEPAAFQDLLPFDGATLVDGVFVG